MKKKAFFEGDKNQVKAIQRQLQEKLRDGKLIKEMVVHFRRYRASLNTVSV